MYIVIVFGSSGFPCHFLVFTANAIECLVRHLLARSLKNIFGLPLLDVVHARALGCMRSPPRLPLSSYFSFSLSRTNNVTTASARTPSTPGTRVSKSGKRYTHVFVCISPAVCVSACG